VKRNIRKVIVLAVLGGLAAQIPFMVFAAYVFVGLTRPIMMASSGGAIPAGSLRPRLQACELFSKWERTHDPNLLNRAVADAHSPRVPWPSKLPLRTYLGGLRSWTQNATSAHSPTAIGLEHAVQAECAPVIADYRHVRGHHNRLHRPRPGQASAMRSAIIRAVRAPPPGN